jgi:membrane-associated protease RseP (regulator of RpoE activity)
MSTETIMKQSIACGYAAVLGLASSAWAIEAPATAAPIPPQAPAEEVAAPEEAAAPGDAAAPPVEMPQGAAPAAAMRAFLGVAGSQVPDLLGEHLNLEPGQGVVIRTLQPDGPAAKAGLEENDVVTKVGGKAVGSQDQLRDAVAGHKPGDELDVEYIHRGVTKNVRIALGSAPADPAGGVALAGPLDQLMLDGMPQDQAKRIREAVEQNLKAFEGLDGEGAVNPELLLGGAIQKRLQQMLQGMEMPDALNVPDIQNGGIQLKNSSAIRMLNADGSGVELKTQDGGKEVRVLGPGGKVEWEGPYDTPQDKETAPPEVREKIDRMNIDMDFKGNGLRLHMRPGQRLGE